MIKTKKDLRFFLEEDAKSNGISPKTLKRIVYLFFKEENYVVYEYIKYTRMCEYHKNNNGIWHKMLFIYSFFRRNRIGSKYGIFISLNTCGYGLRIRHITSGCLINAENVGNYCSFNTGVVVGNKDAADNRPVIGNNVAFAPGSMAFGKITIEDNVFVAPNAVVVKDVPKNAVVGGIPSKVLKYKG